MPDRGTQELKILDSGIVDKLKAINAGGKHVESCCSKSWNSSWNAQLARLQEVDKQFNLCALGDLQATEMVSDVGDADTGLLISSSRNTRKITICNPDLINLFLNPLPILSFCL